MSRRTRAGLGGVVAVLAYLLVVATGGPDVRPMLDGFAPVPDYRWADPPPPFAPGNRPPAALHATIPVRDGVSARVGLGTSDGQVTVALARGALTVPAGDRRVRIDVEPGPAPARALRSPLRPNGNLVAVRLTAQPSGTPITTVTRPGTLVLQVPELSTELRLRTRERWSAVEATAIPPRQLSLSTPLAATGDYLSVTNLPLPAGPSGSGSSAPVVAIGVGAGVVLLVLGAWLWSRRRRVSATAGSRGPGPASPDPPTGS